MFLDWLLASFHHLAVFSLAVGQLSAARSTIGRR
jgi:hypothetical protein